MLIFSLFDSSSFVLIFTEERVAQLPLRTLNSRCALKAHGMSCSMAWTNGSSVNRAGDYSTLILTNDPTSVIISYRITTKNIKRVFGIISPHEFYI